MNRFWKNDGLVIFSIVLVGLHLNLLNAGFYLDDWLAMSLTAPARGYWDAVRLLIPIYADRPIDMLQVPLLQLLSGVPEMSRLWVPQAILTSLELSEGWLLFLLLKRLTGWRSLALSAVGLALLFPNRGGIHYRATLISQLLAHNLILASLLMRLRWWESRRPRQSAISLVLYALGLMSWESPMLMPLFVGGAFAGRGLAAGKDKRRLAAETVRLLWPYGLVLAAVLLWKWAGIKLIFGAANPKSAVIGGSIGNFIKVYLAGFGCATLWPISLSIVRLRAALRELGWLWLVLPFFALWLSQKLRVQAEDKPKSEREGLAALWGACIGGFTGTYAPYVLSASYMPYVNGIMSRLNGMGAWVGGMLFASLVWALQRRYGTSPGKKRLIPSALLFVILSAFTWTNWVESFAWADAWRLQTDIIAGAARHASELPRSSTLILVGVPRFIHGAPVFEGEDFIRAFHLAAGRADVGGNTLSPYMEIKDGALVERYRGAVVHRYPLADEKLRLYDHPADQVRGGASLRLPPAARTSLISKILLGPGMEP